MTPAPAAPRLFRLSGGGNDFLAWVEPATAPGSDTVRALCRRGLSLGADGAFVLRRADAAGVRMDYWNADGERALLCLNGTRCAARLAVELGWARDELVVETGAGPIRATVAADAIALAVPPPASAPRSHLLGEGNAAIRGYSLEVGVPHLVVPWARSLATAPVATLGPELRRLPAFAPAGANVDFVRYTGARSLELRTYERGVEAETLACGTGVLAAAAVGVTLDACRLPVEALTAGGFSFEVRGESSGGRIHSWTLAGDARLVAEIRLHAGAEVAPAPPSWSP